jgi:hypothetical protein
MHKFCMHEVPMPMTLVMDQRDDGGAADDEGAACDTVCVGNTSATGDGQAGGHVGAAADHPLIISTCDLRDFFGSQTWTTTGWPDVAPETCPF